MFRKVYTKEEIDELEGNFKGSELIFTEVKQTPLEAAISAYEFMCADLQDGLCYSVSVKLANKHLSTIKSDVKYKNPPTNREFCNTFYAEYKARKNELSGGC